MIPLFDRDTLIPTIIITVLSSPELRSIFMGNYSHFCENMCYLRKVEYPWINNTALSNLG